jgi:hypothetical protein
MAYRTMLTIEVAARGAAWFFEPADEVFGAFCARIAESGQATIDSNNIPAWAIGDLSGLFVASCVDWEGVEDCDGNAIECTEANRRRIPTLVKAEVASLYMGEVARLEGKEQRPGGPHTSFTPNDGRTAAKAADG